MHVCFVNTCLFKQKKILGTTVVFHIYIYQNIYKNTYTYTFIYLFILEKYLVILPLKTKLAGRLKKD